MKASMIGQAVLVASVILGCSPSSGDEAVTSEDAAAAIPSDTVAPIDSAEASDSPTTPSELGLPNESRETSSRAAEPSLEWEVSEEGPYRAGYHQWSHTYTTPSLGAERTIDIHVWYPTAATEGTAPLHEGLFAGVSFVDAPPAEPAAAAGYPVWVHSHGHLGFAGNSGALHSWMAGHGWVVVVPDHTGNTLSDPLEPRPTAMYLWRSMDISAALDAIEDVAPSHPLASVAESARLERVLLSGHSFGVHTVWASSGATFDPAKVEAWCQEQQPCSEAERQVFLSGVGDPRVVASIAMAGTLREQWFGDSGHSSVSIPILAMSGGEDNAESHRIRFGKTSSLDLTWINIDGGCHQSFGLDAYDYIDDCDTLEGQEGHQIIATYALAFARAHVLMDDSPTVRGLLDGSISLSSKVDLQKQGAPARHSGGE